MSRFNPGDLVSGKYRIVRMIGDGGMGVVYEARHEVLGHGVALKFLHAELAQRPGLTQRFLQEARVSATIQSLHVAHVTDVDTAQDGAPYLVMELLAGQSLQSVLDREHQLRPELAIDFALQILAGLEAAHAIGVVHRDMKPDNVLVTPSSGGPLLKLIDFGIAKLRASSEFTKGLTRAGVVMGTAEYMAPEQLVSAQDTDHRADLYSLGVMLFEMLAGCRPADGDDVELIIAAVIAGRVRKLRDLVPGLPDGLIALVERATQAEREQRFASAAEMRLALAAFAGNLSHAGRLAATSEPLTPLPTPASAALLSLPSLAPQPAFPKTVPPDAPGPLNASQMGGARTSLSDGQAAVAGGTAMGGPAAYGAPPHQYGAAAQYGAAPQYVLPRAAEPGPARPGKRRSGLLIATLVVAVLGGGGAVGYAAYRAIDVPPVVVPPLPDVDAGLAPATAETVEKVNPDTPDNSTTTPGRGSVTARPASTGSRPSTGGASGTAAGTGGTATGASSGGTNGNGPVVVSGGGAGPTLQLPFPLPSGIQIPPIQLPPGFSFPPGFPGVPQPAPGAAPTTAPTTAPPAGTPPAPPTTTPPAAPTAAPPSTPTAAPHHPPRSNP